MKKKKIPCRTPEQLREVALDVIKGVIFTNLFHMDAGRASDIPVVFLPVALGALSDVDLKDVGMIYAKNSDTAPCSINGMPIFFSCSFLNQEDAHVVVDLVKEMDKALNGVKA